MVAADFVIIGVILLIAVIIVTVLYACIVGVPYVPTPLPVARAMITLAGLQGNERVFDLGAGNARILIEAKKQFPSLDATGVELAPTIWLLGLCKIFLSGQRIRFLRRDALTMNLGDADVIFLYLYPGAMARFEDKFDRELRPGTIVIVHAFPFSRRQPSETVIVDGWTWKKTLRRYVW